MNITQFTMEEVRCFAGHQEFNICPLTFLVGENSTGKTTALACFEMLANYLNRGEIDFNSHPYSMGTFTDIVRKTTRKEKAFKLGFTFSWSAKTAPVEHTVEFVEKKGSIEPTVRSVTLEFTDGAIVISADDTSEDNGPFISRGKGKNQYRIEVNSAILDRRQPFFFLDRAIMRSIHGEEQSEDEKALADYLQDKRGRRWLRTGGGSVFMVDDRITDTFE